MGSSRLGLADSTNFGRLTPLQKKSDTVHLSKNIASLSLLLLCTVAADPISFPEKNKLESDVPGDLCSDPINAVLSTLDCIEREDALCAARGYTDSFLKIHN